jgi:hypothetical protein
LPTLVTRLVLFVLLVLVVRCVFVAIWSSFPAGSARTNNRIVMYAARQAGKHAILHATARLRGVVR